MKKIKKKFLYLFGAFLAFAFNLTGVSAQIQPIDFALYGVNPVISEPTLWEKIISTIISPIFIVIIVALALIIGIIIFFKHKKKQNK